MRSQIEFLRSGAFDLFFLQGRGSCLTFPCRTWQGQQVKSLPAVTGSDRRKDWADRRRSMQPLAHTGHLWQNRALPPKPPFPSMRGRCWTREWVQFSSEFSLVLSHLPLQWLPKRSLHHDLVFALAPHYPQNQATHHSLLKAQTNQPPLCIPFLLCPRHSPCVVPICCVVPGLCAFGCAALALKATSSACQAPPPPTLDVSFARRCSDHHQVGELYIVNNFQRIMFAII